MDSPYFFIILTSSICGLSLGFVMHRANFYVAGMFRDLFMLRSGFMLRFLLLVIVASMLLFEAALQGGLLAHHPFPLLGAPSLASLVGGFVFGVGMVLAGGCVVGTLYKMGAGSVLSMVAFAGLLAGSTLYAELHPWWSAFALRTRLADEALTLPQLLAVPSAALTLPLALLGLAYLWHKYRQGALRQEHLLPGSLQPLYAAWAVVAIGLVSYLFVGMPLGITTSYAKLGATLLAVVSPDYVSAKTFFHTTSLDYIPPLGKTAISGGAGPQWDAIAAIQYPLVIMITLGATLSAVLLRELRFHYRLPARQYLSAALGGVLVGLASRMVPGCNIWHLWGGLPILALQSMLFLLGILAGAWLGGKMLKRWVIGV